MPDKRNPFRERIEAILKLPALGQEIAATELSGTQGERELRERMAQATLDDPSISPYEKSHLMKEFSQELDPPQPSMEPPIVGREFLEGLKQQFGGGDKGQMERDSNDREDDLKRQDRQMRAQAFRDHSGQRSEPGWSDPDPSRMADYPELPRRLPGRHKVQRWRDTGDPDRT